MQDVFLFSDTIEANIAYGNLEAFPDDVIRVAKVAQIHEFISSLPAGYKTLIGERGITLSGGQRQRLSIARTLLLDPPILILDDTTSSVDANTERLLREALAAVMVGRTTFVITHRVHSVRYADLILVIEDGVIVQKGVHEDLVRQDGQYQTVYELQLQPIEPDLEDVFQNSREDLT